MGEWSEERQPEIQQLLIRKSGYSNGFLYAFVSHFFGFITQSARARVAN